MTNEDGVVAIHNAEIVGSGSANEVERGLREIRESVCQTGMSETKKEKAVGVSGVGCVTV